MFIKKKGNVSEVNKIGQSETIAIEPSITATPSQTESNTAALPPAIYRYRPNNAVLRVKIIEWPIDFHLPVIKKTGKNTIKEYLYWINATFERAKNSNWLFIYPKKRFTKILKDESGIDIANREYKENALEIMRTFESRYPQIKLDEMNGVLSIKEFEVKDSTLKMPRNLRFKDTIGKKVYQSGIEFYSPIYAKNFIKNRAVENWAPELSKKVDLLVEYTKQIELHLEVEKETLEVMKVIKENLKRESFFSKIKRLFK